MGHENLQLENIKAVILIGPLDFGRCKLASRIPPALWPMLDKPAVRNVIDQLIDQGIKKITVCSKVDSPELQDVFEGLDGIESDLIIDQLPSGTAGTLRDAADPVNDENLFLMPASMAIVPDVKKLLETHFQLNSDLSVVFHKPQPPQIQPTNCADIFVCSKDVLKYIPEKGYFDIKENLVSRLVKDDRSVYPVTLDIEPGNFRNVPEYLSAVSHYIRSPMMEKYYPDLKPAPEYGKKVFVGDNVQIGESVKILGPTVIFDHVQIDENVCINGPVLINSLSFVGKNCTISDGLLWQGVGIYQDCKIQNAVISYDTKVPDNSKIYNTCIVPKKNIEKPESVPKENLSSYLANNYKRKLSFGAAAFIALFAALVVSYWSTISDLVTIWQFSDEYSAGMLVPFLAGYVVWARRKELGNYVPKPAFSGLIMLIGAMGLRFAGLYLDMSSFERLSLIGAIGSIVLLSLGWRLFFNLLPIIMFLILMIPLPNQINDAFSLKLQEWSTVSAVWTLEMMGYIVERDGNIITLNDTSVAVAEACNGLRMIMAFFVIAGWFALLALRKWWEKLVIFVSALPISILCNTIRLAITSIAFTIIDAKEWAEVFHDYGGYAMMPLAIAIILGELWILKNIFVEDIGIKQEQIQEQIIERR